MATEVGSVELGVRLNDKKLINDTTTAANKAEGILTKKFTAIGVTIGKALAIGALVKFGADCLKLGSDLAEVQNVVDVTFPSMSARVNEFAKEAIEKFGLSQKVAKEYMGQLGSMAQAFGFTENASYDMASAITGLAGDVASFYNLSTDESFTKLKAVFTGETEALKSLGVVMTQSALDEYAMANGFGKTTNAMTEQEKVSLRLAFVQNALANASGDFARTSDGWANSTRVLSLRFQELKATLGQGFINVFTPIIGFINVILAGLQTLANYFVAFTNLLTGKKGSSSASAAVASNMTKATGAASGFSSGMENASKASGKVADNLNKAKGALAGFDDLNVLTNTAEESGGAGSGADIGSANAGGLDLNIPKGSVDTSGVDEIENKVKNFFDKVTNFISNKKVVITSLLSGLFAGFGAFNLITNWAKITATFTKMTGGIKFLTACFSTFFGEILAGNGVMGGLSAVFGAITGPAIAIAAIVAAITAALVYLYQTSDQFRTLVNSALDNLMGILNNLWNNVLVPLGAFLLDFFNTVLVPLGVIIAKVFIKNIEMIFSVLLAFWNNVLAPIANFLVDILAVALQMIIDLWEGWKPAIELIFNAINWLWDNVLSPLCDFLTGVFLKAFEEIGKFLNKLLPDITGLFKGFADFLTGVFTLNTDKAMKGVETIFKNFLSFVDKIFGTNFSSSINFVMGIVKGFFDGIKQTFDGIKQFFKGVIDFIRGVFTGDWKLAWRGVVNIFGGIFSTLSGLVKTPINAVISLVNSAIDGINGIGFDVPSWVPFVGGKSFSVDVPKIPMLANGGYIGANTPQLAMIGDNKHEGEIVSPESKLYEQTSKAINDALMAQGSNSNEVIIEILYEILDTLQNLGLDINFDNIIKIIDKRKKQLEMATGG